MNFVPHQYQQYCMNRIVQDPAVGLFLDIVGLKCCRITILMEYWQMIWVLEKRLSRCPRLTN